MHQISGHEPNYRFKIFDKNHEVVMSGSLKSSSLNEVIRIVDIMHDGLAEIFNIEKEA